MKTAESNVIELSGPASGEFTPEQKEYLAGFMAGVAQRGLIPFVGTTNQGLITADPAQAGQNLAAPLEEARFGTPLSDLTKQERWKLEENPLDGWERLLAHAEQDKAPNEEDTFRFRYFGLFWVGPVQNSFMLRCRIPAGELTSAQLGGLADIADEWGNGHADITTRSNIQIREIAPRNIIKVLTKLQELGLTARGSGVDNVRNITASPTAGIDPAELIDARPLAKALHHYILNHRDLYGLPRKFNVAFDGGGSVSVVADTNDIGFVAVRVDGSSAKQTSSTSAPLTPTLSPSEGERENLRQPAGESVAAGNIGKRSLPFPLPRRGGEGQGEGADSNKNESLVPPQSGVYFRVELAGITGHKQFTKDAGILIKPSECVAVAAAMIRVFNEHGDRTDRKKARLKYLIDKWGIPTFLEATQKKLAFPLIHFSRAECVPAHPPIRHGHIGVYKQAQTGRNYIGVVIPVGRLNTRQMRRLADLAQNYGSGNLRLTPWQNLLIPDVPDGFVETVKRNLVRMGLHHSASAIAGGLVACTGNAGCKWAATNTKAQAVALARHLEKRLQLDQPINIHLTGCPNSCAQHYVGDIGLLGVKTMLSGESVEAYNVTLGGGFGHEQAIGKEVFKGIPFSELLKLLERVLTTYLARRNSGESFAEFTRRHEVKQLQEMFSE
ncbi:MAG: NirA family protein [Verrucomicrobia bacterium]|nr:NirA family protein [Verrucomicrobiota bacterium]